MASYADELRKMGKLKRNKKNFETVQAEVESLRGHGRRTDCGSDRRF